MSLTGEAGAAEHYAEQGRQVLRKLRTDQSWSGAGSPGADAEFREFTERMVFAQLYGRPGMSLRDRELIAMGIILTQGSERGITPHFRNCHKVGITEREVRELIFTVCIYGGWPKGSQASVWFNRILQEEGSTWPEHLRVQPARSPEPDGSSRLTAPIDAESAEEHYRQVGRTARGGIGWEPRWEDSGANGSDDEFRDVTTRMVFGELYGRPGLSLRDRELIVMGIILTQGSEAGVKPHLQKCHALGISERDVRELIYTVCVYGGWPKGSQASVWFNRVLQEEGSSWPDDLRIDPPVTAPD